MEWFGKVMDYLDKGTKLIACSLAAGCAVLGLYFWPESGLARLPEPVGPWLPGAIWGWIGVFGGAPVIHIIVEIYGFWKAKREEQKARDQKQAELDAERQQIEAKETKTLHFLARIDDDEKILLAWLVQSNRDHFAFKHLSGAVDSLTNKGILLWTPNVSYYRDVPKFVLERMAKMDELKKIRLPKDLPWMYDGPLY